MFQAGAVGTSTKVTSTTIPLGATVHAGDLLVGWFGQYDSAGQVQVSDNVNGAWTRSASETFASVGDLALYYVQNSAPSPTGVTVTIAASAATFLEGAASDYDGVALSGALDKVVVAKAVGTAVDSGATAAVGAGELVVGGIITGASPTSATPGATQGQTFTMRAQTATGSVDIEDVLASTAGAQNARATLGTSADWYAVAAVFHLYVVQAATISASPSTVNAGGSVTASWSGDLSPSIGDWIGLYSPGAADSAYVSFRYTGGGVSGSLTFVIPNVSPGTYELRLYSNYSYARLATSNPITVQAASLSASPSTVNAGGSVTASWSGDLSPSIGDWIGLYSPGAADSAYVSFRYTGGGVSGSLTFVIPNVSPGTYELRLYSNYSYARLATSNPITVQAASLSASPSTVNAGRFGHRKLERRPESEHRRLDRALQPGCGRQRVRELPLHRRRRQRGALPSSSPMSARGPTSCVCMPTTATRVWPPAARSPSRRQASAPARARSTRRHGHRKLERRPESEHRRLDRALQPGCGRQRVRELPLHRRRRQREPYLRHPQCQPGNLRAASVFQLQLARLATSNPITVQAASLSASPSTVNAGGSVTASWSGDLSPSIGDWIGLYSPGAADSAYVSFRYTGGGVSGSLTFVIPNVSPGTYELRLYSNYSYARLATSNPITVQ